MKKTLLKIVQKKSVVKMFNCVMTELFFNENEKIVSLKLSLVLEPTNDYNFVKDMVIQFVHLPQYAKRADQLLVKKFMKPLKMSVF